MKVRLQASMTHINTITNWVLQEYNVNLLHIESRSSDRIPDQYEFFVECAPGGDVPKVIEILKSTMTYCSVVSRNYVIDNKVNNGNIHLEGICVFIFINLFIFFVLIKNIVSGN